GPGRRGRDHQDRRPGQRREAERGAGRIRRRGRDAVRLLHERDGDLGSRAAGDLAAAERRRDPGRAGGEPLPLRRLHARDPRGEESRWMSREMTDRTSAPPAAGPRGSGLDAPIPNRVEQRIRIEADRTVTAFPGTTEFGEGTRT